MRALAVLLVVGFHAYPHAIKGGFVGVDVFFVLSGFLISTILHKNLDDGRFSFSEFYARRVRRLFPALILVLVASLAAGWCFFMADEFQQQGKHVASGAGFVSNFVRMREVGYFDTAAETKPMLHLWSLGVEEQFYILWPIFLFLGFKLAISRLGIILSVAIASFVFNLMMMKTNPQAMFYLPWSRFWEILVGGLLAYALAGPFSAFRKSARVRNVLGISGVCLIIASGMLLSIHHAFPGYWATIPAAGTLLVIAAGQDAWVNRVLLSNKVLVGIGLLSYPLYLWHWPILTFVRIVLSDAASLGVRTLCVLLSFVCAWFTYRFIELPTRRIEAKSLVYSLVGILLFIGGFGLAIWTTDHFSTRLEASAAVQPYSSQLKWLWWDDPRCGNQFGLSPCQLNASNPTILLLGDSHANALFPGLARRSFLVVNAGTCPPYDRVIGFSTKNKPLSGPCYEEHYLERRMHLVDRIRSVKTVVLASHWGHPLSGVYRSKEDKNTYGELMVQSLLPSEAGLERQDVVFEGVSRTIQKVISSGKKAVFVRDNPELTDDLRVTCKIDRLPGNFDSDCTLPRSEALPFRDLESGLVRRLKARFPSLVVADPVGAFCDEDKCYFIRDGKVLLRDSHHLSEAGSRLVAEVLEPYLR